MSTETDFSHLSRFPGETGNTFDVILHAYEIVERIPVVFFSAILLGIAAVPTWLNWPATLALFGFFLLDWLLVALLPRMGKSYGPSQPPALTLAVLRMIFGFLPMPLSWLFQILGTVLVIVSFWIEPHRLKVTHQSLETEKLPENVQFKILHLGDLHIERITKREKELQHQIDILRPDLILFSGDILNLSYRNDPTAMEQARQVIRQWKAPLGVYMVSGSPAVDLAENLPRQLDGLPVRWLQKEKVSIPLANSTVDVVGITCTHRPFIDGPHLRELVPHPPENFTILLYHTPDLAPIAARAGVDLQFSGHTHGGQVRIPGFGALVTGSLYGKQFEAGRYIVDKLTLYVTRGIGLEGAGAPRLRLFCPPEIILWDIKGTSRVS